MLKFLYAASNGQPKRLGKTIITGLLSAFSKALPYGLLLGVTIEILKPLTANTPLDTNKLWLYCIGILMAYAVQFVFGLISYKICQHSACDIVADGRISMADHLKRLSMSYFTDNDPGRVSSMMLTNFDHVQALIADAIDPVGKAVVLPLAGFVGMLLVDWRMALIMMSVIPVSFLIAAIGAKKVTSVGKKLLGSRTDAEARILEYVNCMPLIKSFGLKGPKSKRLEKSFANLKNESLHLEASTGPVASVASIVLFLGIALLGIAGLRLFLSGEITLTVYIMFLIVAPKIYDSLSIALEFFLIMHFFYESTLRIEEAKAIPEMTEPKDYAVLDDTNIKYDHILFQYKDKRTIDGVTINIAPNTITALVGPSGSGKTTLAKLLARFWDVDQGRILLGGHDITDMPYEQLIEHISMVFQDVYLFEDTILNNIRIAKPEVPMEEVVKAARMANCHAFIQRLSKGYETVIGEGGCTLSGGEKQRISIARAILKDSPIILLDEATASLDPENEVSVQNAINELVKSKTILVIAHHLKTVASANQIVVLNNGKVCQCGTHEKLIAEGGLYARMWNEQQQTKGWKFL